MKIGKALGIASLTLRFGQVERATLHPDGSPETDATHTVMLALLVADLAAEEGMNVSRAVEFALVHDIAEAYAGDVCTARPLTDEARAEKQRREKEALDRIEGELGGDSWVVRMARLYEAQQEPEARLVRFADKILPKLTHALNEGRALEAIRMSPDESARSNLRQAEAFIRVNPNLSATKRLFLAAHDAAIMAYVQRAGHPDFKDRPEPGEWHGSSKQNTRTISVEQVESTKYSRHLNGFILSLESQGSAWCTDEKYVRVLALRISTTSGVEEYMVHPDAMESRLRVTMELRRWASIRLEKIEGVWVCRKPAQSVPPDESKCWYICDTRSFDGDLCRWWRPDRDGYTCRFRDAGLYSAQEIVGMRETDVPVHRDVARAQTHEVVSCSNLRAEAK